MMLSGKKNDNKRKTGSFTKALSRDKIKTKFKTTTFNNNLNLILLNFHILGPTLHTCIHIVTIFTYKYFCNKYNKFSLLQPILKRL